MAKANLLKTETKSFLELIGNGKIYRVPPYQRDYSWDEEHWEDLWLDVIALKENPEHRHYMGALVVEGKSDREFLIIDGQQRIATLSVLALAILEKLKRLVDMGIEAKDNDERMRQLRGRFVGEKDPTSLTESSKLFLNVTDNDFYQDYIVQLRHPQNPRGLPKSNRALWECFTYFGRKIQANATLTNSGAALSELLNESVARQLLFILITVEDDLNAYTVFETLNARGLELSATDLLKNYLFSKVKVKHDLDALGRRWHRLVMTVNQDKFPEFLRYHLLCEEPKIRQQRLFKLVRDRIQTTENVFNLLIQLEARAEVFAAAGDPDHEFWKDRPEAKKYIQALRLFRVRQQMPVVFAAWEKFSNDDFARLLKLLVIFSFRYTVIGGLNPNELEPLYHDLAKGILSGEVTGPTAAFGILNRLYPSDEKFRNDFIEAIKETGGQKQKVVRYVLCELESRCSGRVIDWNVDPASIEHILPENPGAEWSAFVADDRQEQYIYRLGNLTLLEKTLNRDAGNALFAVKQALYDRSQYELTRSLSVNFPEDWTAATIERRQRELADLAVAVWRSDFIAD